MKKLLKIIVVLLVLLIGLFVAASVALRIVLPPEKAKAKLLAHLTSRLHRQVEVGSVSVGILSGLSVTDFKVSEAPDFAKGTFLSSKRFSLHVSLIPLLFRKVIVRQLVLDEPVVNVTRLADGKTFNFSDLTAPAAGASPTSVTPSSTPAAKTSEPPFLLLVSKAIINKGVLHFVDQSPAKQSLDVDPLNLTLNNVSLVSPFSLALSMNVKTRGTQALLDAAGELDIKTATFKFRRCKLESGKSLATMTGEASNLRSADPTADLKFDIKSFDLSTFGPLLTLPAGTSLQGPISGLGSLKGNRARMSLSTNLDLSKTAVAYRTSFQKPAGVALLISANGQLSDLDKAEFQTLGLSVGKMKVTGHGTVSGVTGPTPSAALHFQTNAFEAEELIRYATSALPAGWTAKGPMEFSADLSGTAVSSQFGFKLQADGADVKKASQFHKPAGTPFRLALNGETLQPVGKTDRSFNFQSVTATLGAIEFKGAGSYKSLGKSAQVVFAGKTNSFPLQTLSAMAPAAAPYRLGGNASMDLRASGDLNSPTVNGTAQLDRVSLTYERSDITGLAGAVRFTLQDAASDKLAGKLNGADFSVKFTAHRLLTQPQINLEGNFAELDLDKLLPAAAAAPKQAFFSLPLLYAAPSPTASLPMDVVARATVGRLKHPLYQGQDLELKCNLTGVTPDLSRVSGTAELHQGPGRLLNLEKLVAASTAAKIILQPLLIFQKIDRDGLLRKLGLPDLNNLPFKTLNGAYTLKSGLMNVQSFEMDAQDLFIQTQGTIGLTGVQPLALNVVTKLNAGVVGGTLGQLMGDESGRATLKMSVTGSVADPKVKPEVPEAAKKAAEQLGRDLLRGLGLGR